MKNHPLQTDGQCHLILSHLARGKTLTPLSALQLYDVLRLGGRIYELRRRGHKIKSEIIQLNNGKRVARYSLPVRR